MFLDLKQEIVSCSAIVFSSLSFYLLLSFPLSPFTTHPSLFFSSPISLSFCSPLSYSFSRLPLRLTSLSLPFRLFLLAFHPLSPFKFILKIFLLATIPLYRPSTFISPFLFTSPLSLFSSPISSPLFIHPSLHPFVSFPPLLLPLPPGEC